MKETDTKDKNAERTPKAYVSWSRDHEKEKSVSTKFKSNVKLLSDHNCPNRKE